MREQLKEVAASGEGDAHKFARSLGAWMHIYSADNSREFEASPQVSRESPLLAISVYDESANYALVLYEGEEETKLEGDIIKAIVTGQIDQKNLEAKLALPVLSNTEIRPTDVGSLAFVEELQANSTGSTAIQQQVRSQLEATWLPDGHLLSGAEVAEAFNRQIPAGSRPHASRSRHTSSAIKHTKYCLSCGHDEEAENLLGFSCGHEACLKCCKKLAVYVMAGRVPKCLLKECLHVLTKGEMQQIELLGHAEEKERKSEPRSEDSTASRPPTSSSAPSGTVF